jgi:succinoglycan biosynthesis protein ExoA
MNRSYAETVAPRVSVVVPALNEEEHIDACVRSITSQQVDGGLEVIVVDGVSTDATAERARIAGAKVIENAVPGIPASLNAGLEAAAGEIIVRFDAHAEMPPGYVAACVRALEEEQRVASVGGWREARGRGPWGRALAAALASPFGVGHPTIWRRPLDGRGRRDVEHVPLGCFRADVLHGVGGWREDILTNEDYELDHRLRAQGGRIVFDPAIWSVYRPRESLRAIAGQYWRYGCWKAMVMVDSPASIQPRQLAAPALVLGTALALAPGRAGASARAALAVYGAVLGSAAMRSWAGWRTLPVMATIHYAWGAGLIRSLPRALAARRRRQASARHTPAAISAQTSSRGRSASSRRAAKESNNAS